MKKWVMALVTAAAMSVTMAACGTKTPVASVGTTKSETPGAANTSKTTETTEAGNTKEALKADLEYWSSWSENENQAQVLQEAAKAFSKENPGVNITFTFNGRDNRNLVGSALAAGTKIDMMDGNADNIYRMWANDVLDLTPYFNKTYDSTNGKTYLDSIMPSMSGLSASLFDGKYSYFPYAPQAYMIFCNKGIFDKCGISTYPATWEELMAACEKIKAAGYIPVTTDSSYCTSWVGYYLSRLMGEAAVENLSSDSTAWGQDKVLEGAKAIEKMAKAGYFDPDIASNVYPNAQQGMVINGNVAMYINGSWLPNEVSSTTPDDFKWGAFSFPSVDGGVDGQTAGCYSSYGVAVNKNASQNDIDAAAAFGVYFTTKFDQRFSDVANAIPVMNDSTWPVNLQEAKAVISNYTVRYLSQTGLNINNNSKQIIADACLKLMAGTITAEEFVKEAGSF